MVMLYSNRGLSLMEVNLMCRTKVEAFHAECYLLLRCRFLLLLVVSQVKQLRMDKQVLEAHEAATSALKACREVQGLTVERVEDTLDELAQVTRRDQLSAMFLVLLLMRQGIKKSAVRVLGILYEYCCRVCTLV